MKSKKVITYARKCDITGEGMDEGWVFGDGEQYAKYETDAIKIANSMGYASIEEAYNDDAGYWTEWDKDDHQYALIDGKLIEIN
jgi:hypothetical protein